MKDNTYYGSNDGTSYCLFENPVLRTGVQKETTHFAYRQVPRKPRLVGGDESAQFINNQI